MRRWLSAVVLVLAACGSDGAASGREVPSEETRRQLHLVAGHDRPVSCATAGRGAVVVRLRETFFEPACLTVGAGQPIRLVNDGNARHNVTIRAARIFIDLPPGARRSVRLPQSDATLAVFCRFHVSAGMRATITVA